MPRNLREEIERADRERQQREYENSQKERRAVEVRQESVWLEKKRGEELIREARPYVDQYLMPIFRDIAAAKRVPMRSTSSLLGNLREGFDRLDYGGRLIWNIRTAQNRTFVRYSGSSRTIWDELSLTLNRTEDGWSCWGVDVVNEHSQLVEKVAQFVINGQTTAGQEDHSEDVGQM